ncbi:MAG: cobalamin-binding protein [Planctomycetaceae bacterium]|nr:cobalamin-binding protein [Planctomycetaceae bacterium]
MRVSLLLLVLASCSKAPEAPVAGPTRTFTDMRGKAVTVAWPPKRIVSTVPSLTELLYAVGAQEQLVGVTTYCIYPPKATKKPKIGSINVDYEALAGLKPDVIATSIAVAHKSAAELESQGYKVFSVDPHTVADIPKALRLLGALTGHEDEAGKAASSFEARVAAATRPPGPTVYFEHSGDPLGTSGPDSYVGDALRIAGGRNIFEGGWRLIEWEAVLARDPEVILITHPRTETLERRSGWSNLKAVKNGRVYFVAKEHFLYPTPRLAEGIEEAARLIHEKNP